ncbi:MAG: transglutaminase-like domain-containing protein [Terriglobales bacterium]
MNCHSKLQQPRTQLSKLLFLILAFFLSTKSNAAAQNAQPQTVDPAQGIRAVYRMAGQPTGSYREATTKSPDGTTVTSLESDLIFNRLGSKLEMKSTSQYNETGDGQLKAVASDISSSDQTTHMAVRVGDGTLQISTTTGGKTYERSAPFTGSLLGLEGARRLTVAQLHKPGDTVSYRTFSPELGAVVTITATLVSAEDVTIDQRPHPGLKLEETMSSMPGKITVWLDHEGWMLRQSMPTPLGDIEAIRTQSQEAELAGGQGATLPEETFSRSIVKANIRLPEERLIESIKLKITHHRPDLGWPELDADNQKVLEKTPAYVILQVTRLEPKQHGSRPAVDNASLAPYLAPNALLQSDDSNIKGIAASVAGNERDAWRAARALQQWTNENMHFDAGIAVAPASEVARDRRGTCFGYSMLLGSLTRAAGIPSRLRMGYVYAGGIWGGHAWIEVMIGRQWIPLDGALYAPGAADAARFSFFTSALEEGTLAQVGSLGQLFGNVDITILEYTVGGRSIVVPEDAKPFTITDDTYRNPWLGFSIVKPSSFKFSGFDLVWPQTTVVAMDGPENQRVEVENLSASLPSAKFDGEKYLRDAGITGTQGTRALAGHRAIIVSSDQEAGTVLADQGNVWVFTAKGPCAKRLLEQVISSVVLKH